MLFTFHYTEYPLMLSEARTDGQAVGGMGILFTSQIRRLQNIHSRLLQPFVTSKRKLMLHFQCCVQKYALEMVILGQKKCEVSYGIHTAVSAVDSLFECLHLIDIAVSQETPPSPRAFGH